MTNNRESTAPLVEAGSAARQLSNAALVVATLAERELVRFFRQRTRVVGALVQPLIFWVLFGAGLRGSFQPPDWAPDGMTYQEYFFPGIAVLIVMFTAIFSTISIIEDRREGFLQGVLAAPVARPAIVFGKVTGGTVLAVIQAALFLLVGPALKFIGLAPTIELAWTPASAVSTLLVLSLISLELTAVGYVIAWPMNSTQGFHAIMSIFLMPMWLLSGAFFPGTESAWLSWVIRLNPLTYGVAGLRRVMSGDEALPVTEGLPSLGTCAFVSVLFTAVCLAVAVWLTNRQSSQNVR